MNAPRAKSRTRLKNSRLKGSIDTTSLESHSRTEPATVSSLDDHRERPRTNGNVLNLPVLVLNRHFAPVCLTTARRAILLLYGGAAHALDESGDLYAFPEWSRLEPRVVDDIVPMVSGGLRVPRVLHLLRYERNPRVDIRLTRKNLLLRDDHSCQYCGVKPCLRDLNVDHVLPRSRGGADSWENLVISCRRCNLVKGHRTPEEAGMRLRTRPNKPRWSSTKHFLLSAQQPYSEWTPFLQAGCGFPLAG
ncbi:MAG: HNH endonuclease [Polyangiaceae bacterium]